jgi:hypothetical protein
VCGVSGAYDRHIVAVRSEIRPCPNQARDMDGVGGPDRDRTGDLLNAIQARSQLRYRPFDCGRTNRNCNGPANGRSKLSAKHAEIVLGRIDIERHPDLAHLDLSHARRIRSHDLLRANPVIGRAQFSEHRPAK